MYRTLEGDQKTAASTLFRQMALLAGAGSGYQYVHGKVWDVLLSVVLALLFGALSVDILKGVHDNRAAEGDP
ncbi:MAG: hypothetical protein ABIO65_06955 [Nitrospiria bacterium]